MSIFASTALSLIQRYGTLLTRANGSTIKARVNEKADSIKQTFPNAFDDYRTSGRLAVLRFDGSDAAKSMQQFEIVTDSRSGIRWRIETFAENADGEGLLTRSALASISPM